MPAPRIFSTLSIRDFRLLWGSSSIYVIGAATELIAQGWMVLLLTNDSALWVGIASGIRGAGHILFALIGGVLADRLSRRMVLTTFRAISGLILLGLALLVLQERAELWHLLVVVFIQGSVDGMVAPAFNGLIYDTVGPRRLMNAVAYTLGGFHISWTVGSVLAGNVINSVSIGAAFALAGAVYSVSVLPLLFMKVARSVQERQESVWRNLGQGLAYVAGNSSLRALLMLSVLTETFGFSYIVMLPVIAKTVLNVGPIGLGYLSAAGGAGALIGTAVLASFSDFPNKWRLLTIGTLGAGIGIILFAFSSWYAVSLVFVAIIGLSLVVYDATINTLLQLTSDENMRGRVLGLYGMTWGFTPAGGFIVGAVASVATASLAVGMGGVVIVTYAAAVIARMGARVKSPDPN